MEDFDWNQINDRKLPLVSRKVFSQEKFEPALGYMKEHYTATWNERKAKLDEYRKTDPAVPKKQ